MTIRDEGCCNETTAFANVARIKVRFTMTRAGRSAVLSALFSLSVYCSISGQDLPVISTTNDLQSITHAAWTNSTASRILPPEAMSFRSSLGVVAYDAAFDTNFLNSLVPLTNGGVTRFPVIAVETNTSPRGRSFFNFTGGVVQVSGVPGGYDWQAVARETYGQPPGWLSGENLTNWYLARDPARQHLLVDLISTSSVSAYLAMLTNSIGSVWDGTNNIPLLNLYSNDIAFVKTEQADGTVRAWVHAPTNVTRVDVYHSLDLVTPLSWTLLSGLNHTTDPLMWNYPQDIESVALAAADAVLDQDNDGLPDAREILLYGTSITTNDTDADGLTDGEEINQYDLNALDPNTDGDWFTDLYEVNYGSNPTDAEDAPPFGFLVNGGAFYVNSTNVTLHFDGIYAETVTVKEGETNSFAVTNAFAEVVAYGLASPSNGLKTIFARLTRGGITSPVMTATCMLDTISPSLAVTNFADGVITNARWVTVRGVATDNVSAVSVRINGVWADGVESGSFRYSRASLTNGTNTITVTGEDAAGNATTQIVHVVQSTAGDTNAPILAIDLPFDAEIVSGVTNLLSTTTLPDDSLLYVQGTSDDETADVRLTAVDPLGAALTGTVVQTGTQLWMTVSLVPGTNTLKLLGIDAAGNTGMLQRTIVRDTNLLFAITNPLPYQAINDTGVVVQGVADLRFTNAVISVNGVSCTLNVLSNRVEFQADTPVPLTSALTAIKGQAIADGRIYFCDPDFAHYETRAWRSSEIHNYLDHAPTCVGISHTNRHDDFYSVQASWDAATALYSWSDEFTTIDTEYVLEGSQFIPVDVVDTDTSSPDPWIELTAPTGVRFGIAMDIISTYSPCGMDTVMIMDAFDQRLDFMKVAQTQGVQTVVFQFLNLDYGRPPNVPINPSNITYRGRSGFWYNGNVAFIVPIVLNQEYTISGSDFTWPSYSYVNGENGNSSGHWLSFDGYTNAHYRVALSHNGNDMEEDEYVFISATPELPEVSADLEPSNLPGVAQWRLKIEYQRNRNDEDFYPSASTWQSIDADTPWELTAAMGSDVRGGKATLYCVYAGQLIESVFHIRGDNASEGAVETEIGSTPWYAKPIARVESDEPSQDRYYAQFNTVGTLGPLESDYKWCPNYGAPNGWGIFQLDDPNPSAQQLWDWKANVAGAKAHLAVPCLTDAIDWIALQESQQMVQDPSQSLTNEVFTFNGIAFQKGTARTPVEACAIQRYNGAVNWVIYWKEATTNSPGSWEINDSYREYVDRVCSEIE